MSLLDQFTDYKKNNTKTKCLILSCGPSLNGITKEKVKELSKDHVIVTIKQSYIEFGDYSDFQFFNCNNIIKYERNKAKFIYCSRSMSSNLKNQNIDMYFPMSEYNLKKRLCHFENLEEYFSMNNIGKFFGAGIMFEIVLPFVYNLGVNEILTVGWDYHKKDGKYSHFYKNSDSNSFLNPANPLFLGENEESINNSSRVNSFFLLNGVNLSCVESKECFLHESITRVSL
jgi:hypothetical protein